MVKKGLGSFSQSSSADSSFPWFKIKENDTKVIRFLTGGEDIVVWKRHYLNLSNGFKGSVLCLNDPENDEFDCPLCKIAEDGFKVPVGKAVEKILAIVIDREDNKAKLLEGTRGVRNMLADDYEKNGDITDVDYSFSKKRNKNNWIEYELHDIRSTVRGLTEKELAQKDDIDLDEVVIAYTKTKEEIEALLKDKGNGKSFDGVGSDKKKEEPVKESRRGEKKETSTRSAAKVAPKAVEEDDDDDDDDLLD